jgi:hypothetical protein
LVSAVAGVVAVVVGGSSLASASGGHREDTTFRLTEIRTSVDQVDVGASGLSAGDEFIFGGRLRNIQNTATIGTAHDICTVLTATGAPLHCVTTITLKAGSLELAGEVSGGPNFTLAVTGGTARYDQARGQLVAAPGAGGNEVLSLDIDR